MGNYIQVDVDLDDVLDSIPDEALTKELKSRHGANRAIPLIVARQTLVEAADLFRKMGRLDLAFKLDEIKEDFL